METTNFYRKLHFGLHFDEQPAPLAQAMGQGTSFVGPSHLLSFFEGQLDLLGNVDEVEHIRVEQYRQLLKKYLQQQPDVFYAVSFEANAFATAEALLKYRDELLLGGWEFVKEENTPERLVVLADLEELLDVSPSLDLRWGYAERFLAVLTHLPDRIIHLDELVVHEPVDLLPAHFQRLLEILAEKEVVITIVEASSRTLDNDLAKYAKAIEGKSLGTDLDGDGSLLLLKGAQESQLATFLAQIVSTNTNFKPLCILPGKDSDLDHAFEQEGIPVMGVQSGSLARPTLQLLKLVTIFLWEPIDPIKLLEFLSLASKPLDANLANVLAAEVAKKPGIQSQSWYIALNAFWQESAEKETLEEIKKSYSFWFEKKRKPITSLANKSDVIAIFNHIKNWATFNYDEGNTEDVSLLSLSNQAEQIVELLEVIPEEQLSQLEIENIVRTIYKSSPLKIREAQYQSLDYTHHPGAITQDVEQLLWWNFSATDTEQFFNFWYKHEWDWLESNGVALQSAKDKNALLLWQRKQGVLKCQKQLVLVMPAQYKGEEMHPHPLYDNLEAAFGDLSPITIDLNLAHHQGSQFFSLRKDVELNIEPISKPAPFVELGVDSLETIREKETITALESLFYYPHQWVFRYLLKLRKSSILSVASDARLMGNLAHSCFEALFEEDYAAFDKATLEAWIDDYMNKLLRKEGVSLLMYGMETERVAFVQKVKYAAWSLVNLLHKNNWAVVGTEEKLEGQFGGQSLYGRADLVLKRGEERAVVDLKWRGKSYRQRLLRNGEDLQLVLYAHLLQSPKKWATTGYFIIDKGEMITRNKNAFEDINIIEAGAPPNEMNEQIMQKMARTLDWRRKQLNSGKVEIRCEYTAATLEDHYDDKNENMMDFLEMKHEDDKFDDYRTLIGLVE